MFPEIITVRESNYFKNRNQSESKIEPIRKIGNGNLNLAEKKIFFHLDTVRQVVIIFDVNDYLNGCGKKGEFGVGDIKRWT